MENKYLLFDFAKKAREIEKDIAHLGKEGAERVARGYLADHWGSTHSDLFSFAADAYLTAFGL